MTDNSESVLQGLFTAIVMVAFIGGCTAIGLRDRSVKQMESCLDRKMEWRDGECIAEAGAPR